MKATDRIEAALQNYPERIVACSGGIDSLLLATIAHRLAPTSTVVAHTVTPAVPSAGTARVVAFGKREGWDLELVRSNEFDDERYLANPTDRCYFCKTNLYDAIGAVQASAAVGATVLSGANLDDLGEYRPGLIAAEEHAVHHPYIEAEWTKADIRAAARDLGLPEAELPASPCLASRLYTGTRVTASRLQAVEVGESLVTEMTGITVVRCRVRNERVLVEVADEQRCLVTADVLTAVHTAMATIEPSITAIALDGREYRPGRAIVHVT